MTEPPLPTNPFGYNDFQYDGDYLTCLTTPSVLGIDVSVWQQQIDWEQVKAAGEKIKALGEKSYLLRPGK